MSMWTWPWKRIGWLEVKEEEKEENKCEFFEFRPKINCYFNFLELLGWPTIMKIYYRFLMIFGIFNKFSRVVRCILGVMNFWKKLSCFGAYFWPLFHFLQSIDLDKNSQTFYCRLLTILGNFLQNVLNFDCVFYK